MKYLRKFIESKDLKLDEEDVKNIFLDLIDATSDIWNFKIKKGRYAGEYFEIIFRLNKSSDLSDDQWSIDDKYREEFMDMCRTNSVVEEMRDRVGEHNLTLAGPNRVEGFGINFKILDKNHYDGTSYYG